MATTPKCFKVKAGKIRRYIKAASALKDAELALAENYEPELTALIKAHDVHGMQNLVDQLPVGFRGLRRIYESIEEAEMWGFSKS